MIVRKENSTADTLTAVVLGEGLEAARISSFLEGMKSIADRLVVIASDRNLIGHRSKKESLVYHLVDNERLGVGSAAIRNSLTEALLFSPDTDHILLMNGNKSRLPSISKISRIIKSRLDYVRLSNCMLLSKNYAIHILESDNRPSAINARKSGYTVPSLISDFLHSPRETIEDSTLLKFAMVGASGVLLNELILTIFKFWIRAVSLVLVNPAAVELSIINNFIWNDRFTFRADHAGDPGGGKLLRLVKYNLVGAFSTIVNAIVFYYLYSISGQFYIWSSLAAIAVGFVINYVGSSRWAWGKYTKELDTQTN